VGKTTTAINLSAALARRGRRTLLIDADPQGNSTTGLGIDKSAAHPCVYDVLLNLASPQDALVPTAVDGLWVMPATLNLAGAEIELVSALSREQRLKSALVKVLGGFEFLIIDCPPSLGLLTLNALAAARSLIIPVQPEYFALEGLGQLTGVIELVRAHLNPALRILGVLITMYDRRTSSAGQVIAEVERHFAGLAFKTKIPRNIRLAEAPSHGRAISQFDARSKGAIAYDALAVEVIGRE